MDDEDMFEDTLSLRSEAGAGVAKPKEFISLSRFTVYHSAEDVNDEDSVLIANTAEPNVKEDTEAIAMNGEPPHKIPTMSSDGRSSVDFVLVWEEPGSKVSPVSSKATTQKRDIFERRLLDEGLVLERESFRQLRFVKIHAPHEVLCRYSEILKLRMPMKEIKDPVAVEEMSLDIMMEVKSFVKRLLEWIRVNPKIFKPQKSRLMAEYCRDKNYLFDVDSENFFTPSIKSLVVDFILQREKFTDDPSAVFSFGIHRLISDDTYKAAYPLHDGDYRDRDCDRGLLFHEWAAVRKMVHFQPVDHIKDYFGVKHGLYFAWLGYYTHMLIPASIIGLVCFFYGLATYSSNTLTNDICNSYSNVTMCPLCDRHCKYWKLGEACTYARFTYLFDNPFTVFFAIFMSFWATLFLELWKRYSASITHRWGLSGFDIQAEHPRPEYLARLSNSQRTRENVVTKLKEPYVPFWKVRVPITILSFSVVLLLIALAIGAVFAVVLYRMSVLTSLSLYPDPDTTSFIIIFIPATAATINLVCIMILNWFYDWLAVRLTELELLRTQTEFDDSLTLKIYLFQFVNYYTSIFYIAFLKGKFVGYPAKYNRIFNYRQEECTPGGCLVELCIQLAIIMVGKQAMNSILEMCIPLLYKWYNTIKIKTGLSKDDEEERKAAGYNQWCADYRLLDWGPRGLFPEYLEMVLQYGFVTIFVAAFPLAPFFALLNNILEMRLDAQKFLKFYRRPVAHRVRDIGVWFRILDFVGRLAVVTNAFIIAFSSNFIPRLVYMMVVSEDHTDHGYLNHSLAVFNTAHFPEDYRPLYFELNGENVTTCRYPEYRNPPDDPRRYKRPQIYWHVLAARLAFIVVFQNVVGMLMTAVEWLIPDMSFKLRCSIRREAYLTNEIIIKQETLRARGRRSTSPVTSGEFLSNERDELQNLRSRKGGRDPKV